MKDKAQLWVKPTDEKLVIEDEKKFQEYFLGEKAKTKRTVYLAPVNYDFELSLNKELIEQNQEIIIEQEESVAAYVIPAEKFDKEGRTIRSRLEQMNLKKNAMYSFLSNNMKKSRVGGWFKVGQKLSGLKGGSDRQNHGGIGFFQFFFPALCFLCLLNIIYF